MPKGYLPQCPAKGAKCAGEYCGHCPKCGDQWDNHDHLALTPEQRGFTVCPRDRHHTP